MTNVHATPNLSIDDEDEYVQAPSGPILLFVVTESWYFRSHRLHLARAALTAGYQVHVASRFEGDAAEIEAEGIRCHPLSWRRGGGLFRELRALFELLRIVRRLKPHIIHNVALKPVILGSAVARVCGCRNVVNAVTGLGYAFVGSRAGKRSVRGLLLTLMRAFVDRTGHVYVFQNDEDYKRLQDLGLTRNSRVVLIRGAGIDATKFEPAQLADRHDREVTIAVVSRMLRIKGIQDIVEASHILVARGIAHQLLLVGDPDESNPSSIPRRTLEEWSAEPQIKWTGRLSDVRPVWMSSEIGVLASIGGEGLPKSLLEAASCGRPLVATDVPGNREIVRHGETGLLVPPGDPKALADALAKLIASPELRMRMGAAARNLVLDAFTEERIRAETFTLYSSMLNGREFRHPSSAFPQE